MHLAWHFKDAVLTDDTPAAFRLPSQFNFHPNLDLPDYEPPKTLLDYLAGVKQKTLEAVSLDARALHNVPKRIRRAINKVGHDKRLTFVATDKNLGIACDLTSN